MRASARSRLRHSSDPTHSFVRRVAPQQAFRQWKDYPSGYCAIGHFRLIRIRTGAEKAQSTGNSYRSDCDIALLGFLFYAAFAPVLVGRSAPAGRAAAWHLWANNELESLSSICRSPAQRPYSLLRFLSLSLRRQRALCRVTPGRPVSPAAPATPTLPALRHTAAASRSTATPMAAGNIARPFSHSIIRPKTTRGHGCRRSR